MLCFRGASIEAIVRCSSLAIFLFGCGAKAGPEVRTWDGARPTGTPELCNGLDDDLDGLPSERSEGGTSSLDASLSSACRLDGGCADLDQHVDEDFRDPLGRYVHIEHCGGCGLPCRVRDVLRATTVECSVRADVPTCAASACEEGFVPGRTGTCVPAGDRLCSVCAEDADCGDFEGARCAHLGGERRCAFDCELGCPEGYACTESGVCAPMGGSCSCDPGDSFSLSCALFDPDGNRCPGAARCQDGTLSECVGRDEICDEVDNDCNGVVDDGFRDGRGAYSLDRHNCGACGIDCSESSTAERDLVCGGDPFSPSCVLHCPDVDDGVAPGDRIDADRNIATGCECTVAALTDVPGPVRTSGPMLDVNCDGADGRVVSSIYVAQDGDDSAPGSPTRPMRTIDAALARAAMSLEEGTAPRPDVFVAVGLYTETIHVPDGVRLHGGYRRDFLSLDPAGFVVEVRAPSDTSAPSGAAIEVRGAGDRETVIEWLVARGLDASASGVATFGAYVLDPGPRLILRELELHAGSAGSGISGANGDAGSSFVTLPQQGELPRAAAENRAHQCLGGDVNRVRGGAGGTNLCEGTSTRGGDGGSARCPDQSGAQGAGARGALAQGGVGGQGGQDSNGPITSDTGSCPTGVCCGLSDFSVPTAFSGPRPGARGGDGTQGLPGASCIEPFGRFEGDRWVGMNGGDGRFGTPGGGGGGGGAGGGTLMEFFSGQCEFADGLGGGGGGGGAGGCGGRGGRGATSGAPSVALLLRLTGASSAQFPTLERVTFAPSGGGRGGDGGAGGDGGRGANGAFGGELERSERDTPTLAGPFPGARGGAGGNGGAGGGGGAGCGGGSVGIWVSGSSSAPVELWRANNTFRLERGGLAGRGGGGSSPALDGVEGGSLDVVSR